MGLLQKGLMQDGLESAATGRCTARPFLAKPHVLTKDAVRLTALRPRDTVPLDEKRRFDLSIPQTALDLRGLERSNATSNRRITAHQ